MTLSKISKNNKHQQYQDYIYFLIENGMPSKSSEGFSRDQAKKLFNRVCQINEIKKINNRSTMFLSIQI
uniref:Uncharacterized protein n=1 Tax=Spironucleus salmonicida TaxID=348837 RepID=V6LN94_9EUKA|eukprot:EST45176.1 Hypothetical protein SS50377_14749 [Spironucleus salmonicida]